MSKSPRGTGKSKPSAAEATRQIWSRLGPKAKGIDVGAAVKEEFGHSVPSSTISTAKQKVFGNRGRKRRRVSVVGGAGTSRNGRVRSKRPDTVSVDALADAKKLLQSAGGAEAALNAVNIVHGLQH